MKNFRINLQFLHKLLLSKRNRKLSIFVGGQSIILRTEKAAGFKSFNQEVCTIVHQKLHQNDLKQKHLELVIRKFLEEKKSLPILKKIEVSNFIIQISKSLPKNFFSLEKGSKFLDALFVNVVKENISLYFYKSADIVYVLKLLSNVSFIKYQGDFWYKTEDLVLRQKKDLNLHQIVDITELYGSLRKPGSQVFWGDIEEYLLINSSQFRKEENIMLIPRVILAFGNIKRTNEAFWKVFSMLYGDIASSLGFNEQVKLMDCFANHLPAMSMQLYQQFEKEFLPQADADLRQFKINFTPDQQILVINIIDKYGMDHNPKEGTPLGRNWDLLGRVFISEGVLEFIQHVQNIKTQFTPLIFSFHRVCQSGNIRATQQSSHNCASNCIKYQVCPWQQTSSAYNPKVRELFKLLVNWQHKKLTNKDQWLFNDERKMNQLLAAIGQYQHPIRRLLQQRLAEMSNDATN